MNFLNNGIGYALFKEAAHVGTYVDKTRMIDVLYRYTVESSKYVCVTRPRRFGKSVAANMIAAFFDKSTAKESRHLFESREIGTFIQNQEASKSAGSNDQELSKSCWAAQGMLNVIRINMIDLLGNDEQSYEDFQKLITSLIRQDLLSTYPRLYDNRQQNIQTLLSLSGDTFVFVIDEWDAIFEQPFMTEAGKEKYLQFLKTLLKDKAYVRFAYMTGVLPITKYTSGSSLNMFREFSAFQDSRFYPFFGLSAEEIGTLMTKRGFVQPSFSELTYWYDGYVCEYDGVHVFNPESVSRALQEGRCTSYWTGTGPMNEVRDIIRHNVLDLREDVVRLVGGETLPIRLTGFSVEKTKISTKDEILSAMVVYGFLSYFDGQLRIPNHELMLKFQEALVSQELGLKQTLDESGRLLNATLAQKDKEVAALIEDLHTEKIPFFQYNDENSLACVVTMGYLAAVDDYKIQREDKAGRGYAEFTFEPRNQNLVPIILELKYNHSPKNALACIKQKNDIRRFREYPNVLLVGINYSDRTKKHTCKTEMVHPAYITPEVE